MEKKIKIPPEVDLAQKVCFAILEQLAEDKEVTVDNAEHIIDMAVSMVRICINKGKELDAKRETTSGKVQLEDDNAILEASKKIEQRFKVYVLAEWRSANKDKRKLDLQFLRDTAFRLAIDYFKPIIGNAVLDIKVKLSGRGKYIRANIILPNTKNH